MTNLLSLLLLIVLVSFSVSVKSKVDDFKKEGYTNIEIDFIKGYVCGRYDNRLGCEDLYTFRVN